jgi:AraC family transcriptional regulator
MTRPQVSTNRFFVSTDFSLYYRGSKQLHWNGQIISDYAVVGVINGVLNCIVNDQTVQVRQSQFLIVQPNISIQASGKSVEFLFLTLSPALVIERANAMRLIAPASTVTFKTAVAANDQRLENLFSNFVNELIDEKPGKDIVLRALTEQMLVHVLRNYSTPRRSDELELSRVGLVDRRIRRSVELMHAQLDQDLSLKELAAASYLSPFHFSRLFKKLTGATPHNYLAAIRANRAQLLLAETEMSITEIGTRVGYLSASHFTKAFRSATGTSPREFRRALIQR